MIATITLNPCLDRFIQVNGLKVDQANRWSKSRLYAGGKSIDVARAIHEMGGITVAYGFIGGSAGRAVEILLDEEGVLFSFTPIAHETRTNFIITDTKTNQQTRIDASGPRISKKELLRFRHKIKRIQPVPNLFTIGGSLPPGVPANIYDELIQQASDMGVRTILDAEGYCLQEGIKAKPYLIKPNTYEAGLLVNRELRTENDVIGAALEILGMGVEIAVISRGKDGIIAATQTEIIKAVSPPVKVRSTVGAGDSSVAGLALKLAYGQPLIEACRLAAAMGAAAVMTQGTELCHRPVVERLLPRIKLWQMATTQWPGESFPKQ